MYYSIRPKTTFREGQDFVDLATLYQWLRTDESEKDFVEELLFAAMDMAEDICNQPLFEREYLIQIPRFVSAKLPVLFLPASPAITATYIGKGSDEAVTLQTGDVTLSGNHVLFSSDTLALSDVSGVELTVTLGYSPASLPSIIKVALRYIVNSFYDNRDDTKRTMPTVSDSLLQPYKRYPL